jgi:hypothetical protein
MPVSSTVAAVIAATTAVAGLGMSVVSSISQGRQQQAAAAAAAAGQRQAWAAQQQAYNDQAEAARRNQQTAEENARATEQAGAWEVEKARIKALRLKGSQEAGYGKAGVLLEGSPLEVMAETAELEELDILATTYNYDVQARRYRSQGDMYDFEAQRQVRMGSLPFNEPAIPNYGAQGYLKAGTSLLTTGSGLVKTYGGYWGSTTPQAGSMDKYLMLDY